MVSAYDLSKFYAGKKVFVTGHTGFKGSWLALLLQNLGSDIYGYALEPPSRPNLFEACSLERTITHIHGDIRDFDHLRRQIHTVEPDLVFHLAAQPLVRRSYTDPRTTFETNILGTVNLLEAVRISRSCRSVINVTSDKCYENREWVWGYREHDPLGGRDPYSASKGCAELVTQAYLHSFFLRNNTKSEETASIASVRSGNVIGGGDWGEDRIIPDCIRGISSNTTISIRYPDSIRPWLYVLEPLYGYLYLAMKLWDGDRQFSGAWNFAPLNTEVFTVESIVSDIIKLWGRGTYKICKQPREHESHWLRLDASKARVLLGWAPKYTVEQAVAQTVAWYQLYYSGASPEEIERFSIQQIKSYLTPSLCNSERTRH